MADIAALMLFPALMAYSAFSDLFTMRIANWISAVLIAGFIGLALFSGMPWSVIGWDHLTCGLAMLIVTFTLFAFGWIGGGDAKLAAAIAVWLGWSHVSEFGLLASLLGAGLTLLLLRIRRLKLPPRLLAERWIARLHDRKTGVPYGIALAFSGLVLYPDTAVWHSVVGV